MSRRTHRDIYALVHGHHTNEGAEAGEQVYIRRDKDEAYGEEYPEGYGPKSAKSYNYRANRLSRHGWVEDVDTSDVDPARRAVGTLTETGEAIMRAADDRTDAWEAWQDGEIGTPELIERATAAAESDGSATVDDAETDEFDHGEPVATEDDFEKDDTLQWIERHGTHEDKIAYHDDDYPSDTHGLSYPPGV